MEPLDDFANLPVEPLEAQDERVTGRTPDHPEVHDAQPALRFVHRSPAGDPRTRVEADDPDPGTNPGVTTGLRRIQERLLGQDAATSSSSSSMSKFAHTPVTSS